MSHVKHLAIEKIDGVVPILAVRRHNGSTRVILVMKHSKMNGTICTSVIAITIEDIAHTIGLD